MEPSDPREVIVSFLSGLPQTIRTEALLFVIMYAIRIKPPDKVEEFERVVRDFLMTDGIPAVGAVICAAAVIDQSFESLISNLDRAETGLKILVKRHPDSPGFQQSHLSFPMRRRHWEQALDSWKGLRATKLTPRNLRDFEDKQLISPCY
jgi:hypothetical protein